MEKRETASSGGGVTVVGSDAPSDYRIVPRSDEAGSAVVPPPPQNWPPSAVMMTAAPAKKKRGRPRKYGPDGALSPRPISTAAPAPTSTPPIIDFSTAEKKGKVKHVSSVHRAKEEKESFGQLRNGSFGANFTPHVINVNAGEDITMKIISFSQQGPQAVCILSANGIISSVTFRQADSSGGTLTYEGRFEILSLSGSFMPTETAGTRSRSGGMSVSLASPDGRVIGGGVAGLLVAATPVQVVVGSFLAGNQNEQKPKKQKYEPISSATLTNAIPISSVDPKSKFSSLSFRGDDWSSLPCDSRNVDISSLQEA
ncbi:hypothetical protein ACFE04_015354 [Oxalis oulophora]